jgi:hypothetical protein
MKKTSAGGVGLLQRAASAEIPAEAKNELVERIVASPSFNKSGRLSSFLLHVCELDRQGRSSEISEQQIGEAIFGRSENYDPSIDGIVRSHASRLRLRLDQYFMQEGRHERIRLSIPRGAYLPVFELRTEPEARDLPSPQEEPPKSFEMVSPELPPAIPAGAPNVDSPHRLLYRQRIFVLTGLVVVALLCLVVFRARRFTSHRMAAQIQSSPSDTLWRTMFIPGRETLFVVGDGGANMFENMAVKQITAEEYSSRAWLKEPLAQTPPGFSWAPIAIRVYTPYFAVGLAIQLARLPQVADGQLSVLFARDMRLDNLKDSQAILLGGPNYNPWEQLLVKNQNFHMVYDPVENSISIMNARPLPGEPAVFKWSQTDTKSHYGYSLIVLTRNLNGNGRILMLQGTTAQGDKAAGEFLFDRAQIEPILHRATTPDGHLNDLEIVLETNFIAGGNVDTRVVAVRIHPAG